MVWPTLGSRTAKEQEQEQNTYWGKWKDGRGEVMEKYMEDGRKWNVRAEEKWAKGRGQ